MKQINEYIKHENGGSSFENEVTYKKKSDWENGLS